MGVLALGLEDPRDQPRQFERATIRAGRDGRARSGERLVQQADPALAVGAAVFVDRHGGVWRPPICDGAPLILRKNLLPVGSSSASVSSSRDWTEGGADGPT